MALNDKARAFRALHDELIVLTNVWDAPSAAIVADAGAKAIATGSAGVSWALGRPDGHGLSRADMVAAVARITATVDLPVSADIEAGYGPRPEDVATTVREIIGAGAVGINLEDSIVGLDGLIPLDDQVARLRAAREAADAEGIPDFFINARTDVYLRQIGEPAGRVDESLARAKAFADAGASGFFIPGLLDLDDLARVTAGTSLPVNAMAGPGGPTVSQLAGVGVRRVSLGGSLMMAAYAATRAMATEALTEGTWTSFPDLGTARAVIASRPTS
jgi:2-methylisocitrate lyase-like PEP mutase family enzyme